MSTKPRGTTVFAPAKINLALHVLGRDASGYHRLDTLVAFAGVGDVLHVVADGAGRLTVSGPEANDVPQGSGNLIQRVAGLFGPKPSPHSFHLIKHLPVASGIGGGSADAAAAYRAIEHLRGAGRADAASAPDAHLTTLAEIGADVPMCVASRPLRAQGLGERLTPLPRLPAFPVVLVNPRVPVPTAAVFGGLSQRQNPPMDSLPDGPITASEMLSWLALQRNDLETPARAHAPVIDDVLEALRGGEGCALARMSGSGATCFGLFTSGAAAEAAAAQLRRDAPAWWVQATRLDAVDRAAPGPLELSAAAP